MKDELDKPTLVAVAKDIEKDVGIARSATARDRGDHSGDTESTQDGERMLVDCATRGRRLLRYAKDEERAAGKSKSKSESRI